MEAPLEAGPARNPHLGNTGFDIRWAGRLLLEEDLQSSAKSIHTISFWTLCKLSKER